VRIDGLPARQKESIATGQTIELGGRLGTYTVQLGGVLPRQVQLSVWLRSRHQEIPGASRSA
jgi:hypothetical protein